MVKNIETNGTTTTEDVAVAEVEVSVLVIKINETNHHLRTRVVSTAKVRVEKIEPILRRTVVEEEEANIMYKPPK